MNRQIVEQHWENDSNWTWGIVYCCPDDPRVIVPRRWRWGGWTLNFCHPKAGMTGIAAFALITMPGLFTYFTFNNYNAALVVMLLSIVAMIFWARSESSRFDN